jgi:hypothetical protein
MSPSYSVEESDRTTVCDEYVGDMLRGFSEPTGDDLFLYSSPNR